MVAHTARSYEPVWLVSQGRVIASAHRATTRADRRRGLLGATSITEPLILDPCSWVHTVGMKITIDVAYISHAGVVVRIDTMKPWRIGPMTRDAKYVIESASGSCERWGLRVGDVIEVRDVNDK